MNKKRTLFGRGAMTAQEATGQMSRDKVGIEVPGLQMLGLGIRLPSLRAGSLLQKGCAPFFWAAAMGICVYIIYHMVPEI